MVVVLVVVVLLVDVEEEVADVDGAVVERGREGVVSVLTAVVLTVGVWAEVVAGLGVVTVLWTVDGGGSVVVWVAGVELSVGVEVKPVVTLGVPVVPGVEEVMVVGVVEGLSVLGEEGVAVVDVAPVTEDVGAVVVAEVGVLVVEKRVVRGTVGVPCVEV